MRPALDSMRKKKIFLLSGNLDFFDFNFYLFLFLFKKIKLVNKFLASTTCRWGGRNDVENIKIIRARAPRARACLGLAAIPTVLRIWKDCSESRDASF